MGDPSPILVIEDVRKAFGARLALGEVLRGSPPPRLVALDGVSASVHRNRTLGIVGESGSGKTTLAKAIVRLVEPDGGSIRFKGQEILTANGAELRRIRRLVQLVYQDPYSSLNPRLKAADAILEPAEVHGLIGKKERERRLRELLEQVGLPEKAANRRPRSMSGGQRQRVAIARALATQPEVLIADEVTSALDVSIQAQILNLLTEMQRELGLTMIFISHDLPLVGHVADDVAVMYLGRIVEYGPTAQIFSQPAHPYTAALLAAQPARGRSRHRAAVKGEIPSAFEIPTGCRFRTRCPIAQPICHEIDPPRTDVSEIHGSWCHFAPAVHQSAGPSLEEKYRPSGNGAPGASARAAKLRER
jgi:oligopeptide transport system ATP-binding protein